MNSTTRARLQELEQIARDFIAYYMKRGGCSNCGGVPHSTTCFVGRFAACLAAEEEFTEEDLRSGKLIGDE